MMEVGIRIDRREIQEGGGRNEIYSTEVLREEHSSIKFSYWKNFTQQQVKIVSFN